MARRRSKPLWSLAIQRTLTSIARKTLKAGVGAATKAARKVIKTTLKQAVTRASSSSLLPVSKAAPRPRARAPGPGEWTRGVAMGAGGARSYHVYRPPGIARGERLPLLVMLHGCGQDAASFAASTRMNTVAARERFLVLYPDQDRLANAQGCWNWFETQSGRAFGEVATLMAAIDQVALLYPVDQDSVALAGLSAGASMAALIASRHPARFKAVVMHSGVPPGVAHGTLSALGAMRGLRSKVPRLEPPRLAVPGSAGDWPPLLVIQGQADRVVDPSNGRAAADYWALHTQAHPMAPRTLKRGRRHGTRITDYKHRSAVRATLCEVEGLGHAWSGGHAGHPFGDPQGPDASRMVWAFVRRHIARALHR